MLRLLCAAWSMQLQNLRWLPTYSVPARSHRDAHLSQDMLAAPKTLPSALHYADVRDVGRAHILAAETPRASGRYLIGYDTAMPSKDITDIYQVLSSSSFGPCMPYDAAPVAEAASAWDRHGEARLYASMQPAPVTSSRAQLCGPLVRS